MSDKIKCPSCGKEIKATAKHCGFCGAKIEAVEIKIPLSETESASPPEFNPDDIPKVRGGVRGGATNTETEKPVSEEKAERETKLEVAENKSAPKGKKCTVCGKKMSARAKFCGHCAGALIDDDGDEPFIKQETLTGKYHSDFIPAGDL